MKIVKYYPNFPLNNFVDSVLYLKSNNRGAGLPKINMSLVFNLQDSFKLYTNQSFTTFTDYQKYWVAGFQTQPNFVENYGESKMIVIQFKTFGVHHFLREPLHHFTNRYVSPEDFPCHGANETWEKLSEADSVGQMFGIVEKFLLANIFTPKSPDGKIIKTLRLIAQANGTQPIAALCREINISRKHLNFLFKEFTGVSPKTLSAFYRFQKVLQVLSKNRLENLAGFAHDLEYFDQSHFITDFKRFAGLTPTEYLKLVKLNPTLKIIPHFIPFG